MYLSEIFKKQEKVWVFIEDIPPEKAIEKLLSLGYVVEKDPRPAVCLYKDKTVSYIHGFVSGIYFSQGYRKVKKSAQNEEVVSLRELTAEKTVKRWKELRKT